MRQLIRSVPFVISVAAYVVLEALGVHVQEGWLVVLGFVASGQSAS